MRLFFGETSNQNERTKTALAMLARARARAGVSYCNSKYISDKGKFNERASAKAAVDVLKEHRS